MKFARLLIALIILSVIGVFYLSENQRKIAYSEAENFLANESKHEKSTPKILGEEVSKPIRLAMRNKKIYIPIIVYHGIRNVSPHESDAIKKYNVSPEMLEAQLSYLKEQGYKTIIPSELIWYIENNEQPKEKVILLTFDDGWKNQYTQAFPLLKRYNLNATFYIYTDVIGYKNFMSWKNLKMLHDSGMNIGSHSLSHPYLAKLSSENAFNEIAESKRLMEYNLGIYISDFAYPFGSYSDTVVQDVIGSGYITGRTSIQWSYSKIDEPYKLSGVDAPNDIETFKKILGE